MAVRRLLKSSLWPMLLLLAGSSGSLFAQGLKEAPGKGHVSLTVSAEPATVPPGGLARVRLTAVVPAGYHIYGLIPNENVVPTAIRLADGVPAAIGGATEAPAPKHHREKIGDWLEEYDSYEGTVTFVVPVRISATVPTGKLELAGVFESSSCTDTFCEPSEEQTWSVEISVEGAPVSSPVPAAGTAAIVSRPPPPPIPAISAPPPGSVRSDDRSQGWLFFILGAFGAGLLSLATPCVWPLIPITVSFFTKQAEGSFRRTLTLVTVYAAGIMGSFIGLGFALTWILGRTGVQDFAQNAWVNLAIGSLFVVFALSFFGLFDLQLPSALTSKLQVKNRGGIVGALLLGLSFSVVFFTCTAPFVSSILAIAAQGDTRWPLVGMAAYSFALAGPFFILGLFPKAITSLSRGGTWLHASKVVMGFIEFAAAFKFFANSDWAWTHGDYLTRPGVLSLWVSCSLLSALYLLGLFRLKEDSPGEGIGVFRMLWAMAFAVIGFFLATGLFGGNLGIVESYLPLRRPGELGAVSSATGGNSSGGEVAKEAWIEEYETARLAAEAARKPLFLEFTAFS